LFGTYHIKIISNFIQKYTKSKEKVDFSQKNDEKIVSNLFRYIILLNQVTN